MGDNEIFSPQMLWKDFNCDLPLKEDVITEDTFEDIVYREVYFSGREVGESRVRIFGVFAFQKPTARKIQKKAILIIPDYNETVNHEIIDIYVKLGYSVLMIDYRGKFDESETYTKYPQEVEYANFLKSGRHLDFVDQSAKQSTWFEWIAVAKYGISYLKAQSGIENIGILGIKNGANVGWAVCGSDDRVDCFVPLFGAGWRAYKGKFKNCDNSEIEMNEERIRFLAGIDVQAYAQNVKCPVFFISATNNSEFDVDRACDTLLRVPVEENKKSVKTDRYICFSVKQNEVLYKYCAKDIELFFAKYLGGSKIEFPSEPKISLNIENKKLLIDVGIDFNDLKKPKKIEVFVSEGIVNPAFRDWSNAIEVKTKVENARAFVYNMNGNANFINCFAIVEYKNGVTICSKIVSKRIDMIATRDNKLIYSSTQGESGFSVYDVKEFCDGGVFFNEENVINLTAGPDGILGIGSKYPLINYRFNNQYTRFSERSILMFDVYCQRYSSINIVIVLATPEGNETEFFANVEVNGAEIWQNVKIKCTDFKSELGVPIRDYSGVSAMRFSCEENVLYNNILLI